MLPFVKNLTKRNNEVQVYCTLIAVQTIDYFCFIFVSILSIHTFLSFTQQSRVKAKHYFENKKLCFSKSLGRKCLQSGESQKQRLPDFGGLKPEYIRTHRRLISTFPYINLLFFSLSHPFVSGHQQSRDPATIRHNKPWTSSTRHDLGNTLLSLQYIFFNLLFFLSSLSSPFSFFHHLSYFPRVYCSLFYHESPSPQAAKIRLHINPFRRLAEAFHVTLKSSFFACVAILNYL